MAFSAKNLPKLNGKRKDKRFTFGCFNHARKLTTETIDLFYSILKEDNESLIALKSISFTDEEEKDRVEREFVSRGLNKERLKLLPFSNTYDEHLTQYSHIDLALDPIPYGGATTTCEALSMGVPVLTLFGEGMVGKLSSSLLIHSGLEDYVTYSLTDYKHKANERAILGCLTNDDRKKIRDQFVNSPACDSTRLTIEVERIIKNLVNSP